MTKKNFALILRPLLGQLSRSSIYCFIYLSLIISGEVTSEERATFDKERNLLYQQLDEKDGEINNQSQLISRLQVSGQENFSYICFNITFIQLNPAITDFKGPEYLIRYCRIPLLPI